MRPQLGSLPFMAHLTSGLLAMARAMARASLVVLAWRTVMVTILVAPSPSAAIWRARDWQTSVRASAKRRVARGPAIFALLWPLARRTAVSLVDMWSSMVTELKLA